MRGNIEDIINSIYMEVHKEYDEVKKMKEKLINIINEILETESRKTITYIDDNMSLRKDLGFDSLDLAVFTVKVEEAFGVDIFEDGNVDTILEVLGCINNA
jgi:acyl carrier protein